MNDACRPCRFSFADFELDEATWTLRRGATVLSLQPTPMRLLVYLLRNRGRTVSDAELLRAVWSAAPVRSRVIATALKQVRRVLADDSRAERVLRRRRGIGIELIAPVRTEPLAESTHRAKRREGRLFGLPRGIAMTFLGRQAELLALEVTLTATSNRPQQVVIEGMPGIGKTELALQLIHRAVVRERFAGGVFWLDADGTDLEASWGGRIADQYGLSDAAVAARCAEVLLRLERLDAPILLVLDGVRSWAARDRPHPLPVGPHVYVLATTQWRNLGGPTFHHLTLDGLRPPADRELLCRAAGRDPGPGADLLLADLEGYTLAIETAGVYLGTYRGESAASYASSLRAGRSSHRGTVRARLRHGRSVEETLLAVWELLPEHARRGWLLAACFAPVPATRALAAAVGIDDDAFRRLEEQHVLSSRGDARWCLHAAWRRFVHVHADAQPIEDAQRAFVQGCASYVALATGDACGLALRRDAPQLSAALVLAGRLRDTERERILREATRVGARLGSDSEELDRAPRRPRGSVRSAGLRLFP